MRGKILGFAMALITLAMLAAPVLATNKVPATATLTRFLWVNPNIEYTTTPGGVEHLSYLQFSGAIDLSLNGGTPIPVTYVDVCSGTYNPTSNKGEYVFNEVWTLPGGTFEGMDHPRSVGDFLAAFVPTGNPVYTSIEGHVILHGTGAYAGQMLDLVLPAGSATFSGSWLKP